jgi:hypothetical protein
MFYLKEEDYMKSSVWFSVIAFVMLINLSSFVLAEDKKTVEAPIIKVGDSYKFEIENISNTKLSYVASREVTAIDGNRMTVVTTNEKSGSKRSNYYDLTWGYLGSGADGKDGVSFTPALKYLNFPLSVGKKWTAQSVETDNKTKHQRYHTINGIVESWEKITVPAGEFDALKIVLQTEVKDGDKVNVGTDVSWYVPALKRSIKSELTGKDASTGIEEKKNIRLLSYHVEPDYDEDNPDANEPPEGIYPEDKADASTAKTNSEELYLSIKGCQGTIVKIKGLNSSNASVIAEVKRTNAEEYCERDPGGTTKEFGGKLTKEECIKKVLDEEKSNLYSANADCKKKSIAISHLGKFTMVSHSLKDGNIEYVWRNEESGELVDYPSGSSIIGSQFETLCPAFKEINASAKCLRSEPYIPVGWCQPTESDYTGDWLEYRKEVPIPFHISGLFDGDTKQDEAWILYNENRTKWGVFVFVKQSDKKYKPVKIREYTFADLLPQTIQLRRVDPGEYGTEGEPAKVTLKTHGFMIGAYDKGGTSLIYWNNGKFDEVLLDD